MREWAPGDLASLGADAREVASTFAREGDLVRVVAPSSALAPSHALVDFVNPASGLLASMPHAWYVPRESLHPVPEGA